MGAVQSAMPWGWNGHGHCHGDGHGGNGPHNNFGVPASGTNQGPLAECPPCGGNLDGSPTDYMWMNFPKKQRLNFMIVSTLAVALTIFHFGVSASANNFIRYVNDVSLGVVSSNYKTFTAFGTLNGGSYWGGVAPCIAGVLGIVAVNARKASRAFVIASAIVAGVGIAIGVFAIIVDSAFVSWWAYTAPVTCGSTAFQDKPLQQVSYYGNLDAALKAAVNTCITYFTDANGGLTGQANNNDCFCVTNNFSPNGGYTTTGQPLTTGKCLDIKLVSYRPDIGNYGSTNAVATNQNPNGVVKVNQANYNNCDNVLRQYPMTLTASVVFCAISTAMAGVVFAYAVTVLSLPHDKSDDNEAAPAQVVQMVPQVAAEPAVFSMIPPGAAYNGGYPVTVGAYPMGAGMAPVTWGPGPLPGAHPGMQMQPQMQMGAPQGGMYMPAPQMQMQQQQAMQQGQAGLPVPPFQSAAPAPAAGGGAMPPRAV